jgi:hypothetical protein
MTLQHYFTQKRAERAQRKLTDEIATRSTIAKPATPRRTDSSPPDRTYQTQASIPCNLNASTD